MHHFKLLFINEYGVERLLSMGEDRKLVEYVIEDKARVANFIKKFIHKLTMFLSMN